MPISEAKKRANKKWNENNIKDRYDRINFVVPKGYKSRIQEHARQHGDDGLTAFILRAVRETMERDNEKRASQQKTM